MHEEGFLEERGLSHSSELGAMGIEAHSGPLGEEEWALGSSEKENTDLSIQNAKAKQEFGPAAIRIQTFCKPWGHLILINWCVLSELVAESSTCPIKSQGQRVGGAKVWQWPGLVTTGLGLHFHLSDERVS